MHDGMVSYETSDKYSSYSEHMVFVMSYFFIIQLDFCDRGIDSDRNGQLGVSYEDIPVTSLITLFVNANHPKNICTFIARASTFHVGTMKLSNTKYQFSNTQHGRFHVTRDSLHWSLK